MKTLYRNNVLFLHLTTGQWHVEPLFANGQEMLCTPTPPGGPALAMELAQRVPPNATQTALILTTGPLSGSYAPASGGVTVSLYAPAEQGNWQHTYVSGRLGAALRHSGFDALVITGEASAPCIVRLAAGNCHVEPAAALDGFSPEDSLDEQQKRLGCHATDHTALLMAGPAAFAGALHATLSTEAGCVPHSRQTTVCMAAMQLVAIRLDGGSQRPAPGIPLDNPARAAITPSANPAQLEATMALLCPEWKAPLGLTTGRAIACHHCPSPCRFWVREPNAPQQAAWFPVTSHEGLCAALAGTQVLTILRQCARWGLDPVAASPVLNQHLETATSSFRDCLDLLADTPLPPPPAALTEAELAAMAFGVCPLLVRRHPDTLLAALAQLLPTSEERS